MIIEKAVKKSENNFPAGLTPDNVENAMMRVSMRRESATSEELVKSVLETYIELTDADLKKDLAV